VNASARILKSPIGWAILLILIVLAAASVLTVVPETEQALVVRMGVPRAVVNRFHAGERFGQTGAGLIAHVPLLDTIYFVDKRVRTLDLPAQPLVSSDGQQVEMDAFARYRIVDPTRMYLSAHGDPQQVEEALKPVFGSALRSALAQLSTAALLAPDRAPAMRQVAQALDKAAQAYGARILDVRIDGVALAAGAPLDGALARMRSVREQKAATIRDDGFKQAMLIRANGDAQASKIYADAFNQDPDFYDFYRAMQSYRISFGVDHPTDGSTQMVISPNSAYFRQFAGRGKP
jgi:modulator of FtsH protease HflC